MGIKGNGRGWPWAPYHKPPKPLSKNNQNNQNHQKRANLMEIKRNGRGCPRKILPTTTKTSKQNHSKQQKTLANLMEIKGNGRVCPEGPYHKPPKTLSKNNQNHQNHKKRANLMEIKRIGMGVPPDDLTKNNENHKAKTSKTSKNTSKSDGKCRGWTDRTLPFGSLRE